MDVIDVNGDGFISIEELERWPPDPEQITEHKMANAT
jgi:Ca2+-binding EF-hand superfamily protein